ncbi:hypothetical protein GCM10028784_27140 [Myceligenerans cantabricum]
MRITRKIAVLVTAGAATIALTACQGGADGAAQDPGAADTATSESAAPQATEAGYTAITADNFVERSTAAQELASSMRYTATFSGPAAEAQDMTGAGFEGAMQTGATLEDTAMQMAVDVEGVTIDMILVDSSFYMKMGPLTQDKYLHVDAEEMEDAAEFGELTEQLNQADLSAQTRAMDGAISEVEEVGTETINGVETHHYKVTVDMSQVEDPEAFGLDESAAAGLGAMDLEYFLDEEDQPHRVVMTMPEEGEDLTVTMEFTDHGEPVEIEAPPAGQIIDDSDLGM